MSKTEKEQDPQGEEPSNKETEGLEGWRETRPQGEMIFKQRDKERGKEWKNSRGGKGGNKRKGKETWERETLKWRGWRGRREREKGNLKQRDGVEASKRSGGGYKGRWAKRHKERGSTSRGGG